MVILEWVHRGFRQAMNIILFLVIEVEHVTFSWEILQIHLKVYLWVIF